MSSELELRGIYPAVVTPFQADGSVALAALEKLAESHLAAGATGIVVLGTTGEASALDTDEKRAVVDACAAVCSARAAPLIVGAGSNSTAATVAAVEDLARVPACVAALCVVPYYVRPSEAGIVEHFKVVAAASPLPVVVYNIPYRTGRGLGAASVLELTRVPNIAGLKQAVGSLDLDTLQILAAAPPGFAVLGGDDPYLYPTVLMGGAGGIAASANVATDRFAAMLDCALTGKLEEGRALAEALLPLIRRLFAEPNPAVIKGVLHAQGRIPTPDVRLPLTPASPASVEAAMAALAGLEE